FFHIMKAEAFYQKETDTYETLVSQISVWIDDYNFSRIKTKLGPELSNQVQHFRPILSYWSS
ncbi:MAG: IS3 family transposase, partial [Bacillota bacterium]